MHMSASWIKTGRDPVSIHGRTPLFRVNWNRALFPPEEPLAVSDRGTDDLVVIKSTSCSLCE